MKRPLTQRKCQHCQTCFTPDPRSARRQRHCCKPACRQASKAASQRRWEDVSQVLMCYSRVSV